MDLLAMFKALPEPVQAVAIDAVGGILSNVAGGIWNAATKRDAAAAFARVYREWQRGLAADDAKLNAAFGEFFGRALVREEFGKALADRYEDVDFDVLEAELRTSCKWAGCPVPAADLATVLDGWMQDLNALLDRTPEFQQRFATHFRKAIRESSERENVLRNFSLARRKYRQAVIREHRYIRFAGMAEVSGPAEVELTKVFVMPRLKHRRPELDYVVRLEAKMAEEGGPAWDALQRDVGTGMVILGGPGSGKTTLLESFALTVAELGPWLPVFYRVRQLEKDLAEHNTLWDCLHHRFSPGPALPAGFFHREDKSRGLLVMFDGLDETGSLALRQELVKAIEGFAASLSPKSRVIITSRPFDYDRRRFDPCAYKHFELSEFNDEEIRSFFRAWCGVRGHEDTAAESLWTTLDQHRKDIKDLARNALMATMIVRVHFGLGKLPDSRLDLYAKCAETLLKWWAEAAGLPPSPVDYHLKHKFLAGLAYELQSREPERLSKGMALQIPARSLRQKAEAFLKKETGSAPRVDDFMERLYKRDAILVQYGGDQFGFVHRSFQEYFAANWMAQELDDTDFLTAVIEEAPGWNETLYLAVAQLDNRRRRSTLVDLLSRARAEFALQCLRATAQEDRWLSLLIRFLSKYTWEGQESVSLPPGECAEACIGRKETATVLKGVFARENREGRVLAAAVDLAEELARRGRAEARSLLESFFSESKEYRLDSTERMAWVDGFWLDVYPVTNRDYECMAPAHARDPVSDTDDQPVVNVNWWEANLFCRWRGPEFRLPAEQEWEKAASWDPARKKTRKYPWGDEFDKAKCNTDESGIGKTTPVTEYPQGKSAYGCYDMAGNVWEWTDSWYDQDRNWRVLRGGSWDLDRGFAACASRFSDHPHFSDDGMGFRCART